jgi:hypothetical protein
MAAKPGSLSGSSGVTNGGNVESGGPDEQRSLMMLRPGDQDASWGNVESWRGILLSPRNLFMCLPQSIPSLLQIADASNLAYTLVKGT